MAVAQVVVDIVTAAARAVADAAKVEMVIVEARAEAAVASVAQALIAACGALVIVTMVGACLLIAGTDTRAFMPHLRDIAGLITVEAFSSPQSQRASLVTSLWAM
ncbi:hypothetical protein HK24_04660 [Gluconobacter sp. DsW_058]|nr:hypothetical protein HK24_04660 [Gluconobacter sp. DsW_058]